jgi:hypothetical protein
VQKQVADKTQRRIEELLSVQQRLKSELAAAKARLMVHHGSLATDCEFIFIE